jgi:signal transduction histidine kinase
MAEQENNKNKEKRVLKLEEKEKLRRLRWSVAVRYIVIFLIVAISLLGYLLNFNYELVGILFASTIVFIFNLASSFFYRNINYPRVWPYIGIFVDMVVVTIIVHYTGGIESVFLPLYLLQLVGTNLHFSRIAGPLNFIFGGTLFILTVILEKSGILAHYATGLLPADIYSNPRFLLVSSLTLVALMGISTYRSGYVVWSVRTLENKLFNLNEDLIKINKSYNEANRKLKETDQMKTEFIGVASHQMRTPLSAIKWVFKMLLDEDLGPLNDDQKEMMKKGYLSNERMIGLINDLLNVSRIEEGKFQYQFQRAQLEEVVETVIEEMRSDIKERKLKFQYSKQSSPLPKVNIDLQKMHLAVQNLIDNALKYTPWGGKVAVKIGVEGSELIFSVEDNGVGIPSDQRHRIFTKFFRAGNVIRMQTEGSGLGLFIVKRIIDKHHGRIWYESQEGKGSIFYFTLPIEQKDLEAYHPSKFEKFIENI